MNNSLWAVALLGLLACSCVPNKRLVIAQDKSLKQPQDQEYTHRFQRLEHPCTMETGDVVSVQIDYIDMLESNYQRQAGNEVNARSTGNPYSEGYAINDRGAIHLPLLGEVIIAGQTPEEAQALIATRAKEVYAQPTVRVALLNTTVTVLGEVGQPGTYFTHRCGNPIFQSLALAGGTTTMADLESVKIIRTRGDSTTVFFVDLSDENLLTTPQYYTEPGDVLYVRPLKRKMFTFQESQQVFRGLSVILSVASLFVAISRL